MEYFVSGNYIYQEDRDLTDTIDIHRMLVSVGVKVAVRVMIIVRLDINMCVTLCLG